MLFSIIRHTIQYDQDTTYSAEGGPRGRVVKVADFIIALDHSIISPLWLVWVRAPHGSQVRQVKFYLRVCQVVFPGYSRFRPTFWLARLDMSEIILKGTLNWTKKKKKKKIQCREISFATRDTKQFLTPLSFSLKINAFTVQDPK